VELHTIVEESAEQQRLALVDLQRQVQMELSESGVVNGIIDNISRSIAVADQSQHASANDSLADLQVTSQIFACIINHFINYEGQNGF
jgi:hypothetical protein